MNHVSKLSSVAFAGLALAVAASAADPYTIDFDTLTSPASGVGPAVRAYQEYGAGTFTIIRIADPNDASTLGNHFHTTAGNGSAGHLNATAAEFFSDDGAPILYFDGDYTGASASAYAPDFSTAKAFSLKSFDILSLEGEFTLTSSTGATLTIDHAGVYDVSGVAGFQNILSFRHDYTGASDGDMVIDDIKVQAVPEPAAMAALGLGALALVRRRRA